MPVDASVTDLALFPRKRWTVRDCRLMVESGLLEAGKFELIEGDIVFKRGQNRPHIRVMTRLMLAFALVFADRIQTQAPVGIGAADEAETDPEPDLAVLAESTEIYLTRAVVPSRDVSLVIEVADSTLRGDLTVKALIYSRAGIPDYWVIDVQGRRIVVHRQAGQSGYGEVISYAAEESVSPLAAPQASVRLADFLPSLYKFMGDDKQIMTPELIKL